MPFLRKALNVFVGGVIFIAFVPAMFELSLLTGIGFFITWVFAFYEGVIFKDPMFVVNLAIGYIFTNIAISQILPLVFKEAVQGTIIGALIILGVFLMIYLRGKQLQSY